MQAQTSLNSLASECKESRVANHNAEKGWVAKAFSSFSCFLLLTLLYLTEEKKIVHHVVVFKIDIVGHTSEYPGKYNYVRSLPYQQIDSPPETIVASIYLYL